MRVNLSGHNLFAGPGLTGDQNIYISRTNLLDQGVDSRHRRGRPYELAKGLGAAEFVAQSFVLGPQPKQFCGIPNQDSSSSISNGFAR